MLNGRKMWITNGSVAGVAVVWAQTEEGIRGFVVPTDTPGFSAPEIKHKVSLRASITSELVLDDVRLPADAVLPRGAAACRARCPASTRRATASSGARSGRRAAAWRPPASTASPVSSSADRSAASS